MFRFPKTITIQVNNDWALFSIEGRPDLNNLVKLKIYPFEYKCEEHVYGFRDSLYGINRIQEKIVEMSITGCDAIQNYFMEMFQGYSEIGSGNCSYKFDIVITDSSNNSITVLHSVFLRELTRNYVSYGYVLNLRIMVSDISERIQELYKPKIFDDEFIFDSDKFTKLNEVDYENYQFMSSEEEAVDYDVRDSLFYSLCTIESKGSGNFFSLQFLFRKYKFEDLKEYDYLRLPFKYNCNDEIRTILKSIRIPKTRFAFENWIVGIELKTGGFDVLEFSDKDLENYGNGNPDGIDGYELCPEISKIEIIRENIMKNHVISNLTLELPEGMSFTNGDFSIEVGKKDKVTIKNGKVVTTVTATEAKEIITKQCEGKMFCDLPKQIAALISETTFVTEITYKLDQSKLNLFN